MEVATTTALLDWCQARCASPRSARLQRPTATLCRDLLVVLGRLRACCLLDAEHGRFATHAAELLDFLGAAGSAPRCVAAALAALRVVRLSLWSGAEEVGQALWVVEAAGLAARVVRKLYSRVSSHCYGDTARGC